MRLNTKQKEFINDYQRIMPAQQIAEIIGCSSKEIVDYISESTSHNQEERSLERYVKQLLDQTYEINWNLSTFLKMANDQLMKRPEQISIFDDDELPEKKSIEPFRHENMYERIERLVIGNGFKNDTSFCRTVGINEDYLTDLKSKLKANPLMQPRGDNIAKIAEFLDVPEKYLRGSK